MAREEHKGGCIGLGFDLWRMSTIASGLGFDEQHDVWVIGLRFGFWLWSL